MIQKRLRNIRMPKVLLPTLSVVIPESKETELTELWCRKELKKINHELIIAHDWRTGYQQANGEYVAFIEKDCVLSEGYFKALLALFDNKSYRKLAMVSPALGVNHWQTKVYGYRLSPTSVLPSQIKSSTDPYLIQIGYIPGSIIRRSALGNVAPSDVDVMLESANLSIYFWIHGKRIIIHPDVTYVSTDDLLDLPYPMDSVMTKSLIETMAMWSRELIG
jgi:hypothetical protein